MFESLGFLLLISCSSLLDTSSDIVAIFMLLSLHRPDILPDGTFEVPCIIYGLLMLCLFVLQDDTAANLSLLHYNCAHHVHFVFVGIDLLIANASILID